jgi:hypothetical protein
LILERRKRGRGADECAIGEESEDGDPLAVKKVSTRVLGMEIFE